MAKKKKPDDDEPQDNINNGDDTFGLPEIEYQPLKREETTTEPTSTSSSSQQTENSNPMEREEAPYNEDRSSYYIDDDEGNSPWPKILGITAILLLIAAGFWYFAMYRPKQQAAAEKQRLEREAAEARQREADLAEQKRMEDERRRADSLAMLTAMPTMGTIDTLSERTGRYYVVVASAIDGDLLMDYAKTLTPKGVNTKIIFPYDTIKFYRLAVAEGDTYRSTQATADQLKSEYSGGAWVLKY